MMTRRGSGFLSGVIAVLIAAAAQANGIDSTLRVYGNTTTLELAPVLLAADRVHGGDVTVRNGGIPNLFVHGEADVATNAETQALRESVDHPNLRIIFTVAEGFYRIVARRSAGIGKLEDLRGKRIATVPRTSSAYYLHRMLATVGLDESDVVIVPMVPLDRMPAALAKGEVDAVTIWEPEIERARELIGDDAIEFQDRSVYRELFNLNTTAEALADPEKRCTIVAFVRSLIEASKRINGQPQIAWPLVAKSTGYDTQLLSRVWHHEGFPGTLVPDLLDVLEAEEVWVAKERNRRPRTRAELAKLVDDSVVREAVSGRAPDCAAVSARARQANAAELARLQERAQRLAVRMEQAEGIRAVKRLQHAYGHYFSAGRWNDVAGLFAEAGVSREGDAQVVGRYGIAEQLRTRYGDGRDGIADGQLSTKFFLSPVVTFDPDGRTVRGRWHSVSMLGRYGESASWAGGIYENVYVNEGGVWKLKEERYFPQYAGPYETGWRNVVREPEGPTTPIPFHYDPTRAGTPIPPSVPNAGESSRHLDFASLATLVGELEQRARRMNDAAAVQNLQHAYGYYVDRKMWDDVADLFAPSGTMEIDQQGVFVGRSSIRRALERAGPPGLREGEVNEHLQLQTVVTVADDGRTAHARGTELRMLGVNGQYAQWGLATFENTYVKHNGRWMIQSMRVYPRMTTDYYKGWARDAQPAAGVEPDFPPDRRPTELFAIYPKPYTPPIHFAHPVSSGAQSVTATVTPRTVAELRASLDEAERLLAVAEAYDGAENVANAYGYYIDEFLWNETGDLFSENGWKELSYIGTYVGRDRVRDSMIRRYGLDGRRPNSYAIHQKTQPVVTVAPDGKSARIRARLFQINSSTDNPGSYISGIYENQVVLENGVWKISAMDLDYVWTTGYVTGWAKVNPDDARRFAPQPTFAKEFPPDRPLRGVTFAPFPQIAPVGFHYRNPVSGREPPLLLE